MANSSPPSRATVSAARAQERNRSAAAMRSRSPSAWPRLSLTLLKSSRSRKSTVIGLPLPLGQRERVAHPVAEERAVGEAGERIVERLVGELLLQPLPLAHVAGVEHDAADGRVAAAGWWPGSRRGASAPSGWRKRHSTGPVTPGACAASREERRGAVAVVGVQQGRDRPAHQLARGRSRTPGWPTGSRTAWCRWCGSR